MGTPGKVGPPGDPGFPGMKGKAGPRGESVASSGPSLSCGEHEVKALLEAMLSTTPKQNKQTETQQVGQHAPKPRRQFFHLGEASALIYSQD